MKKFSFTLKSTFKMALLLLVFPLSSNLLAEPNVKSGDFSRGANVWRDNCGRCHNIREPRELRDDQWYTSAFHMRIRGGLTGQETRDVIAFLAASNKPTRNSIIAENISDTSTRRNSFSGQDIYKQTCIACHGADGKGTLPGAPDFTNAKGPLRQSDEVLIKRVTEGFKSPGSPMAMPAKGGNAALTDADIVEVIRYLRKFRK